MSETASKRKDPITEYGMPKEGKMVEMLLKYLPLKVEEYASEERIPVRQAAEELIEGYVVSGTVSDFLEECERIRLDDSLAKVLERTT